MTQGAAVRGCWDYSDQGAAFQPSVEMCSSYCAQQGADACEWEESSGGCWVEFGTGCYVEEGYAGWYAAVLNPEVPVAAASTTGSANSWWLVGLAALALCVMRAKAEE